MSMINGEDVIAGFLLTREPKDRAKYQDQPLRFEQFTRHSYAILNDERMVASLTYRMVVELEKVGFLDREEKTTALPKWTIQVADNFEWVDIREPIYGRYNRNDDNQMARAVELIRGLFPDQQIRLVLSSEKSKSSPPITPVMIAELIHHIEKVRVMLADLRVKPSQETRRLSLLHMLDFRRNDILKRTNRLDGVDVERARLAHNDRMKRIRLIRELKKRGRK